MRTTRFKVADKSLSTVQRHIGGKTIEDFDPNLMVVNLLLCKKQTVGKHRLAVLPQCHSLSVSNR